MSVRGIIKKASRPFTSLLLGEIKARAARNSELLGRMASWQVRSRERIHSLSDVEFRVSSQWGEDGIIDWIVERASVPPRSRSFIEFGVEDYRESNTRFLLQNRNWRGMIMDANPELLVAVRKDGLDRIHDLTVQQVFITRDNINELLERATLGSEPGLLSIDVDGNDYWIWEAIEVIRPIICICEYNAVFGDVHPISVPYDPGFSRTVAHHSNLYYGASVQALRLLASRKGYQFLGTTSAANDAFFIRDDYAEPFISKYIENIQAYPSFAKESVDRQGVPNYIGGLDRFRQIARTRVVNTVTGVESELEELGQVYSAEWKELMLGQPVGKISEENS